MINAVQLRKGMIIRMNDKLYRVEDMEHITPGNYQAVVQTKIRDLADMTMRNHRFRSSEKVERVTLDTREISYSYADGDHYVFMDNETYEQISLTKDFLGDVVYYLKENLTYLLESFENKPMNITPPLTLEFEVVETEKSLKGATVQASYKPAKLENGLEITVPQFVDIGNVVKVDTRDGSYIERISK